jgi:hypothetical protein
MDALLRPRHTQEDPAMDRKRTLARALMGTVAATLLAATTGCVHVAPYERGTLAHPTMSAEDPFKTPMAAHVEDISEGAIGGLAGGGGGCGCN